MPQRSDRIQREVDELLTKLEQFPPKRPLGRRIGDAISAPFRALGNIQLPRINAGHILLAAIIIIVVAYVAGGSGSLWTWIMAGGAVLFILAFVLSLRRRSRPASQKYWRDRPLDLNDKGGDNRSFWDRWRGR